MAEFESAIGQRSRVQSAIDMDSRNNFLEYWNQCLEARWFGERSNLYRQAMPKCCCLMVLYRLGWQAVIFGGAACSHDIPSRMRSRKILTSGCLDWMFVEG